MIDRSDGRLTEEGLAVVARARRVLSEIDALVADVAACKDEVAGTVRVGMIGTTARWLVPRLDGRRPPAPPEAPAGGRRGQHDRARAPARRLASSTSRS